MKALDSIFEDKVEWDIIKYLLEYPTYECKTEELGSCMEPEIISSTKIHSCRKCKKLFNRESSLERHLRKEKGVGLLS